MKKKEIESSNKKSTFLSRLGKIIEPISLTISSLFVIESGDPTGALLKFNQFISLVHRFKFINIWYGEKLDPFLNRLGRWDSYKENVYRKKVLGLEYVERRRILEFNENYEKEILDKEKSFKGKFNRFLEDFNFNLVVKIKETFYLVLWILHLFSLRTLKLLKEKQEICSEKKLKFFRFVKKIRFLLLNSSVLDFFFYGTRFILHRKIDSLLTGLIFTLVFLIFSLKIYDIIEIFTETIHLQNTILLKFNKKEKNQSKEEISKNHHKRTINRIIDVQKTLEYHSRNHIIQDFTKSYIEETKEAYSSTIIVHSNNIFLLRLCLSQVIVASLMYLPTFLIILLLLLELLFNLSVILISLISKAKIKTVFLIPRITQFLCLIGIFSVFLLIVNEQKKEREVRPVSQKLQNIGIYLLIAGYSLEIVVVIFNFVVDFVIVVKKNKEEKKSNDVKDMKKIGEIEGEYFYKIESGNDDEDRSNLVIMGRILNQENENEEFNFKRKNKKREMKFKVEKIPGRKFNRKNKGLSNRRVKVQDDPKSSRKLKYGKFSRELRENND